MGRLKQTLITLGLSSAVAFSGSYLVSKWEGKSNKAYPDPIGIWTICYGQTKGIRKGDYKTDSECLDSLAEELSLHDRQMLNLIAVPITPWQHAAFLSFVYNVGVGNFSKSTLLKKLNKQDYNGACAELKKWVYAGGNVLNGLVKRREAEYRVCIGDISNEDRKELEKGA